MCSWLPSYHLRVFAIGGTSRYLGLHQWVNVLQVSEPEVLAFRGRRTGTSQVRRKLATNAVLQHYKPPPTAPAAAGAPTRGVPVQRTINELFQKQAAATALDSLEDMQLA